MRNFVAKEDDPIIFASTYETAAFVSFLFTYKPYRFQKISSPKRRGHSWAIRTSATRYRQS
jgi:hypothetical protein